MKHLTESQLNEFIDGCMEAPAQARMEAHLSGCADCQARLASLQSVFRALAALPEEMPEHDLASSIMHRIPRGFSGLGWRVAFAMQAGMSLGLLLLMSPFLANRILTILIGWNGRLHMPAIPFLNPMGFHASPSVIPLPHPPNLALPFTITNANFSNWLILGIAAVLLFVVGNFSLIFHNSAKARK